MIVKARLLGAVGIAAVACRLVDVLLAQTPACPAFDVASVKPNKSGDGQMTLRVQTGGRLIVTNMTLGALIASAYRTPAGALRAAQIVGGPDWLNRDHFDIDARGRVDLPPGPSALNPDTQEMLKTLLADRFKLVAHQESRGRCDATRSKPRASHCFMAVVEPAGVL